MRGKMRLLLCMVLIGCFLVPAAGAFAVTPSYSLYVYDNSGVHGAMGAGEVPFETEGHKMYAHLGNFSPSNIDVSVKWSTDKPGVASVNSKGAITCKKQGIFRLNVKVTDKKSGGWRKSSYIMAVIRNATTYTDMPTELKQAARTSRTVIGSALDVYVKGGNLYAKMFVFNGGTTVLSKSVSFDIAFWPEFGSGVKMEDAIRYNNRKVNLAAAIPPGLTGRTKEVKLGKLTGFKASRDYLLDAFILATAAGGKSAAGGALPSLAKLSPGNIRSFAVSSMS